jgi:hypothetical protein
MPPLMAPSAAVPATAGAAVVGALDVGGLVVVGAVEETTTLDEVEGLVEGTVGWAAGGEPPPPSPMAAMAIPGTAAITSTEMAASSLCRLDQDSTREERRCRAARELIAEALSRPFLPASLARRLWGALPYAAVSRLGQLGGATAGRRRAVSGGDVNQTSTS